jgi:two-component system response regulator AtoC
VRELENAIERALVLSEGGGRITSADLDDRFDVETKTIEGLPSALIDDSLTLKEILDRVEKMTILRALERTNGNRTRAAVLLGISHRALLYKLKDHGLS